MAPAPVSMATALTVVEPTSRPTMYLRSSGPPQSQASCLTLSKTRGFTGFIPLLRSKSLTVTSTFTLLLPFDQPPVTGTSLLIAGIGMFHHRGHRGTQIERTRAGIKYLCDTPCALW